ncbi:hypothetical protein N7462_011301 [Penicillium macrosclerotiorum]|uniref:uncharacterized protein n=1 Tax=Penicillium macrosclerotiorum TaxID=303699 RepID=UPI0025486684|nr:uncharacterized protein N7462_011301 [Penicillium macrosclerotiorum]KAJ5666892.1 hypothetical protein N7462_011301 [Penicillium macrosclerotiorum]
MGIATCLVYGACPVGFLFSLPLPSWLQPTSTRVAQYDRRKRKKLDGVLDEDEDGTGTIDATSEADLAGHSQILTPNETHQYRVAGLSLDQELPGGNFPHGPAKDSRSAKGKRRSHHFRDLSTLSSPIYPPRSPSHQDNVRLQHLATLTAILHRCLLQRDYIRAGRAWGLLMREEFRGFPADVRNEGRWGIGAEILLRRGQTETPTGSHRLSSDPPSTDDRTSLPFTKKGFADAKEYYERLILNHPFTKSVPHAISALHFYSAMFGLWVYVTQEESNAARHNINLNEEDSSEELSDQESSDGFGPNELTGKKRALVAAVRVQELQQAQKIASRMDMLLASPPYSDSLELLELRGMISLWIGDLLVSSLANPPGAVDEYDEDAMHTDDLSESLETRREQRLAIEKRETEIQKANDFFERAKKHERGVAYNLEQLHIDDHSPFG